MRGQLILTVGVAEGEVVVPGGVADEGEEQRGRHHGQKQRAGGGEGVQAAGGAAGEVS